ncbi:unnamed protein product [Schistosoma curassoni]|uniref:Ribonuclease H-like domain-containing protein n=1 Tax=Schistosoma curassoni TaxID=6186 RepID=A0A183JWH8_9TREM|nr:unnamed protein product [Schistosoma curassoni]
MELLDVHSDLDAFEDYFERFEMWAITEEDVEDVNIVAHFLTFIGKEAYSLLKSLAMPEKPISLPYTTLKELLLSYAKYTNFDSNKGRFCKVIHQDIKNSTTLLRHPNPVHTEGYAGSVESYISSELNETQNPCETTVSNQSVCQNSHVIVPGMVFPNDSHISDEIPCKSEENMFSEHNYDRKPDVVLMDVDFSNDSLLCNDILNKF